MKKLYLLLLIALPLFVKAGSVSISGTKTISPGETVALPVIVSSSNKITGAQMVVSVDGNDFEVLISKTTSSFHIERNPNKSNFLVYTDCEMNDDGTYRINPIKGTAAKIYIKAKSTATPGNTATLSLKNIFVTTFKNNDCKNPIEETAANYSTTLTVGAVKSTNNYLSSLEIAGYTIQFDKTKTSYSISSTEVGSSLKVTATVEDAKANVKVTSPKLVEGNNTISVVVTSESGAKRTYTITVNVPTKEAIKEETNLKSLTVTGYNLNFSPNKTDYILNVESTVNKLEIKATAESSDAKVEVKGPDELTEGENNYKVVVTDNKGNTKTYNILVNKKEAKVECETCQVCKECTESESGDTIWKILAIALVIVTLAETIFMVTMRDKKKI